MASDFVWAPSRSPSKSKEPKVRRAQFGDGYAQVSPQGLNHNLETWDLSFDGLTDRDASQIDAFLESMEGHLPFYWRNPEGSRKLYLCGSWSRNFVAQDLNDIRATFKEFIG